MDFRKTSLKSHEKPHTQDLNTDSKQSHDISSEENEKVSTQTMVNSLWLTSSIMI